ncbi:MAG: TetR/AcrR family transcriptional regulator [Dehalococcoidia bacterium]|nr:MAG: TetR/AcrR family transcriptional regulator [Dehalococcoidia bacterium]
MPRTTAQFAEIRHTRAGQILDAARQVFAAQGFHATRMSDIAQVAGVSQGTLYHYFRSKDELFLAVLNTWNEQLKTIVTQLPNADLSATDKLWSINQIGAGFFEAGADLLPVLVEYWAYLLHNPTAAAGFRDFFVEMQGSFKKILQEGIANGEFKAVDEDIVSALPLVVLDGLALLTSVLGKDIIQPLETLRQTQRLIFEGMLAGRQGKSV